MTVEVLTTRAVRYQLEIDIQASAARAWQALSQETNDWWLPDFHVAGADSVVTLDVTPGGHLIERTTDGGGIVWYTVYACAPGRSMTLVGPLSVDCGPATTMLTLVLQEMEGGCRLRVTDELVGHVSDSLVESLRSGWEQLLGQGLKRHAETAR